MKSLFFPVKLIISSQLHNELVSSTATTSTNSKYNYQCDSKDELDVDLTVNGLSSVTDLLCWSDAGPILCYALLSL